MKRIIKNGYIIADGIDANKPADILIEDRKILNVGYGLEDSESETVNAAGMYVYPGFIDMHCTICDPGHESVEDIETASMSAAKGGFTTIACTPNTMPVVDNKTVVEYIITKSKQYSYVNIFPYGSMTIGCEGKKISEMGEMIRAGAVGISDGDITVENARIMRNIFVYSKMFDVPIITHCEDASLSGKGTMNDGRISTLLGLSGMPREAEDIIVARNIVLAENTGARLHIAHISTKGSVQYIRQAKARGVNVTCETCPHYFTLTEKAALQYNTYAKVIPPLRTREDNEAIIEGLADGTIDVIASGHMPARIEYKQREFDMAAYGISAFETAFALSNTALVNAGILTRHQLMEKMSKKPAEILRFNSKGEIKVGMDADIVIIDADSEYCIDPDNFYSKAKFTPAKGMTVSGVIKHCIVGGKSIF
ncbi:dihydroorotase [Clostridiales bacterium]|nr:dihydroorotase [Clostridiales bacterium]